MPDIKIIRVNTGLRGTDGSDGTDGADGATGPAGEIGKRTMWIPASAMQPRTTSGTEATTREINSITLGVQAFDTENDEGAQFSVGFAKRWDEGTVTAQAFWTAASGVAAQTVEFEIRGGSFANDAAINSTGFGTAVAITDAFIAADDLHVSSESSAITVANAAVDTLTVFEIIRDTSDDSLATDAELIGIKLFYDTDTGTDD
jgi:hypothetical protein